MPSAPFRQLPFEHVPELPRVPHAWAATTKRDLSITTPELGTVKIRVHEYGEGPPLLLVHGLMTAGYSFRYVIESLGAKYRLVIPDLPGAGHSGCPDVYMGPDVLARSLIAIVDALGIRGCRAVGNSMGGYLCMRAALIDPGVFSQLVNLHSPGIATLRMHALRWAMRLLPSFAIVDHLVKNNPERWVHTRVHYIDESLKSREEHRELAVPLQDRAGRRTFYRHLRDGLDSREMKKFARALQAAPFPIPILLVYAETDPVVPPVVGDKLKRLIPDAGFIQLANASHFAHVDAADRFVEAITPFLAGSR